jgi:hypothetical protein
MNGVYIGSFNHRELTEKQNKAKPASKASGVGFNHFQSNKDLIPLNKIPSECFHGHITFARKTKAVEEIIDYNNIKRKALINDQDFTILNKTTERTIQGVIPYKPLRTDDVIINDTRIDPVVPGLKDDLIYPKDSLEFDQVNALVHTTETRDMINNYWGIQQPWAFDGPITINAHARFFNPGTGEYTDTWDNAFYDRHSKGIELLTGADKRNKGLVHSARSADTIAHEVSHAKLDGIDPYYCDSKFFVCTALHETFADFNAVLHAMQSKQVLDEFFKKTGGNLHKNNLISMIDEEFGQKVLAKQRDCLRNALNYYKHPASINNLTFLPVKENQLALEPHIYSQVLTGAIYDILADSFDQDKKIPGLTPQKALMKSRDEIGSIFNKAFLYIHSGETTFKDVAKALIHTDKVLYNGAHREILIKSFKERNVLNDLDIKAFDAKEKQLTNACRSLTYNNIDDLIQFIEKNQAALEFSDTLPLKPVFNAIDDKGNRIIKLVRDYELKIPDEKDVYFTRKNEKMPVRDGITFVFSKDNRCISCISKELSSSDKKELLTVFAKFCEYRYKPLQDSYDELEKEWKKREEEMKKNKKKKHLPTPKNESLLKPPVYEWPGLPDLNLKEIREPEDHYEKSGRVY